MRDMMILRSICFVDELGIDPYFVFDGNDYLSTHFIFYDDRTPVGSLRVRWFAGFAKYERTCFLEAYRHPFTIKRCIEMTFEHVARKGYTCVMTQSEPRLSTLWTKLFGFQMMEKAPLELQGHPPYHAVLGAIKPADNAITPDSASEILIRIEGQWDPVATSSMECVNELRTVASQTDSAS